MELRMKDVNIIGGHEKPIYSGELPKKKQLGQFSDFRGGLTKTWEGEYCE